MISRGVRGLAADDATGIEMVSRGVEDQAAKDRKRPVVDWKMASVGECHEARS